MTYWQSLIIEQAYSSFLVSHTVEMAPTEYYVLIEENSPSSFRVQHLNSTKRLYKPGAKEFEASKLYNGFWLLDRIDRTK